MKKKIIIIVALFLLTISCNLYSQEKKVKSEPKLSDISYILNGSMMATVPWYSYYVQKISASLTIPKDIVQAEKDLDKYLIAPPTGDKKGENTDLEYYTIKKYVKNLHAAFQQLNAMTPFKPARFFYHDDIPALVNFNLKNNTDLSLVIAGGDIDLLFDRKALNNVQRPAVVLKNYILPSLKIMASNFSGDEIKYFGMTIVYGTFQDNKDYSPEWVGFAASAGDIKKYATGQMSAEKLIDAGEIYISSPGDMTQKNKPLHIKYSQKGIPYDIENPDTTNVSPVDLTKINPNPRSSKTPFLINELRAIYSTMPGDGYKNPYPRDTVVHFVCNDTMFIDTVTMKITGKVHNKNINFSIREIQPSKYDVRYFIKNPEDQFRSIRLEKDYGKLIFNFPFFGVSEKTSVLEFKK